MGNLTECKIYHILSYQMKYQMIYQIYRHEADEKNILAGVSPPLTTLPKGGDLIFSAPCWLPLYPSPQSATYLFFLLSVYFTTSLIP